MTDSRSHIPAWDSWEADGCTLLELEASSSVAAAVAPSRAKLRREQKRRAIARGTCDDDLNEKARQRATKRFNNFVDIQQALEAHITTVRSSSSDAASSSQATSSSKAASKDPGVL